MSDTDSFIDEVTEEVRRDRLFALMRRYGWIAILTVFLIVGGAVWNEWRKAQERNSAQALGDSILNALEKDDGAARTGALSGIEAPNPASQAVLTMLTASEESRQDPVAAASRLLSLAETEGVPPIYRQIATLKAVSIPDSGLSIEERRMHLEGLRLSSGITRLLAEEQLAYLDIETGNRDAALDRLLQIAQDAQATAGLRQRATQVIVALGGEPSGVPATVE